MHHLVTGGAGFIGGFLCERLLAAGDRVTVLDDLSTGRYENVAHFEGDGRFALVVGSVTDMTLTERYVRECDAVFHLASAVGVQLIMDRPVEVIETIFQGTDVVLKCASRYRRKVMLTSTSEVYGKSDRVPFEEDGDRLAGPTTKHRWAYACAKALDEFLALAHHKQSGLPVVCVRLFNTVGPRQSGRYGMVVPRFVQHALAGRPLVVHGSGRQSRCFCHVLDVVEALSGLMASKQADGQVVNVGSADEVTIEALARRVIERAGSDSQIQHRSYEEVYGDGFEDMPRRVPSLQRVGNLIGWRPRRDLDAILDDVIRYERDGVLP